MANYASLKAAIQSVIKQNGNNEITGNILQQSLLAMVNALGAGFQYVGLASPTTNPGTPDQNVFYIASNAGTYTNFGGIVISSGEIAILKYNGTWTKEIAGAASLEQLNILKKEVEGVTFDWVPGYINQYGNLTQPDGYSQITSRRLYAGEANGIVITWDNNFCVRLAYFDGNTLVSRSELLNSDSSPYTIQTNYDVYITLATRYYTTYTPAQMLEHYQFGPAGLFERVSDLEILDEITVDLYGTPLQWTSGNIDANGNIIASTQSNYYSQILPNAQINGIKMRADAGYLFNLALYDNGEFVGRYGWKYSNDGEVTISTPYDARLMIGRDTYDNTQTAEQVAAHVYIGVEKGVIPELNELEERVEYLENSGSNFISKIVACDFYGKILHFSFDDTCWCLYDLIQNVNTYESIFDEPFFAMLKSVHEQTGMVFTLNTFNAIATNTSGYYPTGFNISNVPTKFQSDFQANKNWLKFAFHAKDENTNYATALYISEDYATFVSAIYTLTGDYECLDNITRLGYFGGSLANCLALRDAEHGLIGFYGADDARSYDYYLTQEQYTFLRKKGKLFDAKNNLIFIKTQYRTFATGKQDVENNLCFQKVTEFFAHEYEAHTGADWDLISMQSNILSLATWAAGLGYKFDFPGKIYG